MLKKNLATVFCLLLLVFMPTFAEPVVGGNYCFRLTHPDLLTGAASSAGGAFFSAIPASIAVNPSLTASEQRVVLNLGYTVLFEPLDDLSMGGAGQIALLVPSRWGVFTGVVEGVFCDVGKLNLKNSIGLRAGFSKDINEKLYAGVALNGGARWADGTQWSLGFNLGFMYKWGDLAFLRDVRIGGAVTNLGKPYENGFPAIGSPRVGVAGTMFTVADDRVACGFSLDVCAPQFMNVVLDAGLQIELADVVVVKTAWQFDMRDTLDKNYNLIPSVGITVRFGINTKGNQFMAEKGWQQSEVITSAAWQKLYGTTHAASAAAAINLGLKDTAAPEIILWGEN